MSDSGEFTRVGAPGDFREGRGSVVVVQGVKVAVFRIAGKLYGIKDACPHMGASLGDGKLEGHRVICHMHGWTFDLQTGMCSQTRQNSARLYEIKVDGNAVFLRPPPPPPPGKDDAADEWVVFDPDKHLK